MNILPTDINYEEFVGMTESQHVRPAADFMDDVFTYFQEGDKIVGDALPWEKTRNYFRMRPAEVTIWGGINGHFKSMILGQTMLFLPQDRNILIASLEMQPVKTLARMARQGIGVSQPGSAMKQAFTDATSNIWLYDQVSSIPVPRLLGMIEYVCSNQQIHHICIDSLMMCVAATDDYSGQKGFITQLSYVAKKYNCHVHLVAHVRKGLDEYARIGKFSLKGASELVDIADNLILVQKNLRKLEARAAHKDYDPREPDEWLMVSKQRDAGFEGGFNLFHDPATLRFLDFDGQDMKWRV